MLIVGLTGSIGAGKSLVANEFKSLGVTIIDTDAIAHALVLPGEEALDEIIKQFGQDFLQADKTLNRKKLRELIFSSHNAKRKLEAILQPKIRTATKEAIAAAKDAYHPYCIVVVPLLIETKFYQLVNKVLVITATEEQQIQRIQERDKISEQLAKSMLNQQISNQDRIKYADDIIENNGNLAKIQDEVTTLHFKYLNLAKEFI